MAVFVEFSVWPSQAFAVDFLAMVQQKTVDDIEKELRSLPADVRRKKLTAKFENGDTALIFAARQGNLPLFDVLAQAGADPNARDANGRDILNIAVRLSNPQLAKHAISAGTDVTALTKKYQGSNLIFASHQGEVEIVKQLIAAGAPLDRINVLGWTALLEATILGNGGRKHQAVVKALLSAGADQTIADESGLTPLDHARRRGHNDMVSVLSSDY